MPRNRTDRVLAVPLPQPGHFTLYLVTIYRTRVEGRQPLPGAGRIDAANGYRVAIEVYCGQVRSDAIGPVAVTVPSLERPVRAAVCRVFAHSQISERRAFRFGLRIVYRRNPIHGPRGIWTAGPGPGERTLDMTALARACVAPCETLCAAYVFPAYGDRLIIEALDRQIRRWTGK